MLKRFKFNSDLLERSNMQQLCKTIFLSLAIISLFNDIIAEQFEKVQILSEEQMYKLTTEEFKQYRNTIAAHRIELESYMNNLNQSDSSTQQYINEIKQHCEFLEEALVIIKIEEAARELYIKNYCDRSKMQRLWDVLTIPLWPRLIIHELGHACTAKLLNGDPINIHLGAKPEEVPPTIWNCHKTNLSIHSYNCNSGFSLFSQKNRVPIFLAGPLAGMATSLYMFKKVLEYIKDPNVVISSLAVIASFYVICAFEVDALSITPFDEKESNDGQQLWKNLGLSEKYLSQAREVALLINFVTSCISGGYWAKKVLIPVFVEGH